MPFHNLVSGLFRAVCLTSLIAFSCLALPAVAAAQDDEASGEEESLSLDDLPIDWEIGPCAASIGRNAEIEVPAGYRFTAKKGAQTWNEGVGNPPDSSLLGVLLPDNGDWVIYFSFDDIGYIKDAEKEDLDADGILKSIRLGNAESNEYRKEHGWPSLDIVGWRVAPRYDQATNNLVWGIEASVEGEEGTLLNYNTRILGRDGVMSANLAVGTEQFASVLPETEKLLGGFSYKSGHKYSEWTTGDKVAAVGLTGLIAGGGAALAAKTGLLAKLGILFAKAGKVIILVIVGGLAVVGRFIARLFGRRAAE